MIPGTATKDVQLEPGCFVAEDLVGTALLLVSSAPNPSDITRLSHETYAPKGKVGYNENLK